MEIMNSNTMEGRGVNERVRSLRWEHVTVQDSLHKQANEGDSPLLLIRVGALSYLSNGLPYGDSRCHCLWVTRESAAYRTALVAI